MSRMLDSDELRPFPCACVKIFLTLTALTVIGFVVYGVIFTAQLHQMRGATEVKEIEVHKNQLRKIAEDIYLVHTVWDRRHRGEEIRVLVYAKQPNYNVECGLKDGVRMLASWHEISGNGKAVYRAFYLTCNLPAPYFPGTIEQSLSMVEHEQDEQAPRLGYRLTGIDVDYDLTKEDPEEFQTFYGLCVPILDNTKYSAEDLIEFVELNRILGAERITFVIRPEATSDEIESAMHYYSDDSLVTVLNFSLPFPDSEVADNGENVARDICLHHHLQTTEFVGFCTLREFLVPVMNSTMVEALRTSPYYESGVLKIRAVTFPIRVDEYPLSFHNHRRSVKLVHKETRGIVRPRQVIEMGPNFANQLVNTGRTVIYLESASHLAVYRFTDSHSDRTATVEDRTIIDRFPELGRVFEEARKAVYEKISGNIHTSMTTESDVL